MRFKLNSVNAAFMAVTTLFFAWGFTTSNNDPLIASLKATFELNYTEALLTQLVSFAAYGLMSFPAAALLQRFGAVRSILVALITMVAGCLLVQFVAGFHEFWLILAALFVLAVGITVLQVAANPLAAALGPPESSHYRLTFAQAFNSLGVVMGVNFGSRLMLGENALKADRAPITNEADRVVALGAVSHAFLLIAVLLSLLAVFVWTQRENIRRAARAVESNGSGSALDALRSRWALFGALAIGLYVGAEVSIGSIMINFLNQPEIWDLPLETAGFYLANVYWMGALVGRFIGSFMLTRVSASLLLLLAASAASLLCLVVALLGGPVAGYAALAVGLFNSIMFPTIFTISLERSRASQAATSGLLCLAIVGGAMLPYIVGRMADQASLTASFMVPMLAYGVIAVFGMASHWPRSGRGQAAV